MNQPVPVSRNAGGVTVCGPAPQLRETSAETSEMTRTAAGLARRTLSWTDSPAWACAFITTIFVTRSPRARASVIRRIIGWLAGILHYEGWA